MEALIETSPPPAFAQEDLHLISLFIHPTFCPFLAALKQLTAKN
jgi:hypothetical protein